MAQNPGRELSRNEAVGKLLACRDLLNRLNTEGLNLELSYEEHQILLGFKQVWLAGYLDGNSHIYRQANLLRKDIAALNRLLVRSQDQDMRRLHEGGND